MVKDHSDSEKGNPFDTHFNYQWKNKRWPKCRRLPQIISLVIKSELYLHPVRVQRLLPSLLLLHPLYLPQPPLNLLVCPLKHTFYHFFHIKNCIISSRNHMNGFKQRKEGNVLFNDALNTFNLRLYGIRHMVKDHSDSERGNLLLPQGLLFPISSKGSFICIIPQTGWHIPQPLLNQSWSTGWNEK